MIRWQNSGNAREVTSMVRLRFRAPADLARHLELRDGDMPLLFVPHRAVTTRRLGIEVVFDSTDATSLLHGTVRSRDRAGVWLEVPAARAALPFLFGPTVNARGARRFACELFAEAGAHGEPPVLCRVADVSATGLRLTSITAGLLVGDEVALTLVGADTGALPADVRARVAWISEGHAGLEAVAGGDALRALAHVLEERYVEAPEFAHADDCACAAGEPQFAVG
jgi:hypothetical protein